MAQIKISELHPAGFELFQDSETFLNELGKDEMSGIEGGALISVVFNSNVSVVFYTLATANSNTINANSIGTKNTIP